MATLLRDLKQLAFPLKHLVCAAPKEHRQQHIKAARRLVRLGEGELQTKAR